MMQNHEYLTQYMHDKLIMILNNGAAHENYGQASKMNLDIILTR